MNCNLARSGNKCYINVRSRSIYPTEYYFGELMCTTSRAVFQRANWLTHNFFRRNPRNPLYYGKVRFDNYVICFLFAFLELQPIVVVFSWPGSGL
jgi:hypothetical protein